MDELSEINMKFLGSDIFKVDNNDRNVKYLA
jgi:hypothetical protein